MSEPLYCVNHPTVETYLRCNRCGDPICPKCAIRTEVGYRCPACTRRQQQVFYAEFRTIFYLVAAAVALPLGLIGGYLIPMLGWFSVFLGPLVGMGIAEVAHWAIRRRRGQYTWLVVAGCIVVGALPRLLISLVSLFAVLSYPNMVMGNAWAVLWGVVYVVSAAGAAIARLRTTRRR